MPEKCPNDPVETMEVMVEHTRGLRGSPGESSGEREPLTKIYFLIIPGGSEGIGICIKES